MINKNRLIKTFLTLVQINSPSGQEKQVADFVLKYISNLGFKAKKDKVNNVYVNVYGSGKPLFLNAHLDTVQPGENIQPVIKNGIIKSRGNTILGADNKVAIAALLEFLQAYKNQPLRALEIVFTVAEETSGYGALSLDYSNLKSKQGFCFDCGQPLGAVVLASPHYASFDINIQGKEAHAAHPDRAINALQIANQVINQLKLGQLDSQTIFNIGLIKGGSARNTVPGNIQLHGEIRSFSREKIKYYCDKLKQQIQATQLPSQAKIQLKIKQEASGYQHKKSDPMVKKTMKIIKAASLQPKYQKLWTCSDANIFNAKKLKVLNLSDGVKNIHTTNESVTINDLAKLTKLIIRLIKNF